MSEEIKSRSEILFLYDVKDANPNGDPVDENRPRIDEETGVNIVTDVRLKRTIRDYLHDYKGLKIFIREVRDEEGNLKTKEDLIKEDLIKEIEDDPDKVMKRFIDTRLFGATTAVKEKTVTLTGPVQFKYGRSLHRVNLTFIKGTTVMPSRAGKGQGTFTERYILPYSLIAFYGVVNENAAKNQNIGLTEADVDYMLEGMWHGTKNLISGSKFGQMPRLLIQVIYKEGTNFYIGELDRLVTLQSEKTDESIRDVQDFRIVVDNLIGALSRHSDKIDKIRYKVDERLILSRNGSLVTFKDALSDFNLQELGF